MPVPQVPGLVRRSALVATLLLSALLTARGSGKLVAASLSPIPPKPATPRTLPGTSAAEPAASVALAVLERNIFDSASGSMAWNGAASDELGCLGAGGVDVGSEELPACGGNLRLVATSVVPRRPELSLASFSTGVEGKAL